ncbi:MAG TPA: immunoglobulin domain-containing protein [Verrucomicrobiae bacterium]|jgi:hypothetical protein
MKKSLLPALALAASLATAQAQYFTNGNLAVVRISGYDTTSSTGAAVFIDQYTTNGALANSFAVPTSGANSLILNGEPYEGLLNIMPDGSRLVFAGYHTALPYASNIISSESALVPRVVATLDGYGVFSLAVTNMTNFNDSAISAAASDGTNFWLAGTGPTPSATVPTGLNEIAYVGTAASGASAQVVTNVFSTSLRGMTLCDVAGTYQLYAIGEASNTALGTFRTGAFLVSNISGALPTSGTGVSNAFAEASPAGGGAFAFDLAINPDGTIAYLADNDNGIVKFTSSGPGGVWVSNYTVPLTNAQGATLAAFSQSATSVTADWSQTPPVVYATTGETATNRLVTFQDTNANGLDTVTTLALGTIVSGAGGATNTYRGVRFVPVSHYPYFSVQPAGFTGAPGQSAIFSASVLGAFPSYQWYSNSVANPTFVAIPGAMSSNYIVASVASGQGGSQFYLVASNAYGVSTSAVVTLTVLDPAITASPTGATNIPGTGPVTLCVTAVGTGTLTYQWLANGVAIPGAQSSCYTVPDNGVITSAAYSVIVSNSLGQFATTAATTVSFSPYLINDTFTYPNGNLFGDAGSPWKEISGTTPIDVISDRAQISQTNTTAGTAFAQDLYTQPKVGGVMWASFTMNLASLPTTPGGIYFTHFEDTNFGFFGRLFVLTSNNPAYTADIPAVAYPGTYRIGVANKASSVAAVVELDMSPGIDYQVVEYFDMNGGFSGVAVNPSQSEYNSVYSLSTIPNALSSGYAQDTYTGTLNPMAGQGLRQAAGTGTFYMDNLEVSYDWNGAGSGFTAVTANSPAATPVIGLISSGLTNYAGNTGLLEVAASGVDASYAWYQIVGNVTNKLADDANHAGSVSNAFSFYNLQGGDTGGYYVVVANSAGSATSAVVNVSVNSTPTPPVFTLQPVSTTNSLGGTVTFTATAVGTGPITYQWNTDGSPNGATGTSYTLTRISTALSGNTYSVTATGGAGSPVTSSNAVLTVLGPIVTNIAYLRSLQVTSAAPTITIPAASSTQVYEVTGTVMEYTNLESATYAEYWIQDATGGIEFFVIDPTFRPHQGDVISATGIVDVFDDALELDGSANNPSEPYSIISTNGENQPLPYPNELMPFGFSAANPGLSSLVYQGRRATATNVYFQITPGQTFAGGGQVVISNLAGQSFTLYVSPSSGPDLIGQPIPPFAYSVTGEYDQFNTSYEFNMTSGADIVTAPPPAVTNMTAAVSAGNISLSWSAVSQTYTYSVWSTTNLTMPFTPLATGLWFSNSAGAYSAPISTNNPATFYQIVSP